MKLKTHSGTKKRVKITGTKKVLYAKASKRHLLINKSKRQKRSSPLGMAADITHETALRRLMPYAKIKLTKRPLPAITTVPTETVSKVRKTATKNVEAN